MSLLMLLAVICFALAVLSSFVPRMGFIPWGWLGLFFWALTALTGPVMVG